MELRDSVGDLHGALKAAPGGTLGAKVEAGMLQPRDYQRTPVRIRAHGLVIQSHFVIWWVIEVRNPARAEPPLEPPGFCKRSDRRRGSLTPEAEPDAANSDDPALRTELAADTAHMGIERPPRTFPIARPDFIEKPFA